MFAQRKALENSEKSLSEFIPYSAVIAPGVVICREGDLVATVKISGKVFEAVSNEALQRDAERQNNFLKVMASASSTDEMSLKVHRIRRVVHDELSVPDENSSSRFVRDFVRAYNREISENNLMATELYVSLVSHKATLLKRDKYKESEIREELNERLDVFGKVFDQLVSSLRDYEPAVLGEYEDENGVVFSHQLSFYNFLLTGQWQKVRVPFMPLNEALGNVQVFGGADTLEFQTALGKSYVQSIELKDYPMATYSRLLDGLLYNTNFDQSSYPFIETQTFTALSKNKGLKALKLQQNQLRSAEDDAVSQMHYLTVARDMVANGQIVIGDYSYSLLVFGSEDTVVANANDSVKKLQDAGFLPIKSTLALVTSYLHQLPGRKDRPRVAKISSMNFAHLASFHNFPCGKRDRNPWGEAVALMKMPSDQPYYFNFHYTDPEKDSLGDVPLGNTAILGASGAGKTAFFLYPNLEYACASGMSFLALDTKGDLARNYGSIAKKYYGYKHISVIDLRNPTRSDGNNLLTLINRYMDIARKQPDNLAARAKAEKYAKILAKSIVSPEGNSDHGQNAFFYDAADGLLSSTILLLAEFLPPDEEHPEERRHIVSVFKLVQDLLEPARGARGRSRFQLLMDKLPSEHKAR